MHFPVSIFAMVMGLSGLTIAYERAENILQWQTHLSTLFLGIASAVFALLVVIYTLKWLKHADAIYQEFKHPVKLHFFPAISISLLLLSVAYHQHSTQVSLYLWWLGAGLHLLLTLTIVSMWIHHTTFEINHMNPSWFIPAVGNILVPIAGVHHASAEISWFFFSIGFGFWVILLVIFFNRIIFHHPLPQKLLPTLFILIAPPAVGFISYFNPDYALDK